MLMPVLLIVMGVFAASSVVALRLRTRRTRARYRARRTRWASYQRLWNTVVRPQRVKRLPDMRDEG